MYSSMLKWKKGDKKNGQTHWTLRRSMRGKSKVNGVPENTEMAQKPVKDKTKRRSIKKSIRAAMGVSVKETKEREDTDIIINHVKEGELKAVEVIHTDSGARVKVSLYGGNLLSFRAADGKEKLFVSKLAEKQKGKALRGGVPVVFPQFGKGSLPNHGFARTAKWELCDGALAPHVEDDLVHLALRLTHNKETSKMWNHKFELVHMIRFGPNELETSMNITNKGKSEFEFQSLLHTYFRVRDISQVTIEGLEGLRLIDKLQYVDPTEGRQVFVEHAEKLKISSEIDNIYMNAGREPIVITSVADNSRVEVNMALCCGEEMVECDAVLWNPWKAKAGRLGDMDKEEYRNMLCVEPGCASRKEVCEPGQTWTVTQNMKFSKLSKYGVR